jgi:fructokinase
VILICGEALVDLVPAADGTGVLARPGGSPANVAVALGRLGVDVALLTRLSTDHNGQLIRVHLEQSHVDLSLATITPAPATVATVTLDRASNAAYTFGIEGGADDGWRIDELPANLPDRAPLFVSGALALAIPSMAATVTALLAREYGHRLLALDPNPRPALTPDRPAMLSTLDSWLVRADLVKVSEEDLAWTFPGQTPAEVALRWRAAGPSLVVVTRGADGVYALGPDGPVELPAPPVELVDTVGAGDAFSAGLLAGLDRSNCLTPAALRRIGRADLTAALQYAGRVAALTCGRVGADPPWLADLPSGS